jgi:hypothetical protein
MLDKIMNLLGWAPFRCSSCGTRFRLFGGGQLRRDLMEQRLRSIAGHALVSRLS